MRVSSLAAAALLTFAAAPAFAQYATFTDNEKLKAARTAFETEKWADAVAATTEALAVPGNSLEEMVEIWAIRGICLALSGKKAEAVESFKVLVAIDYDHRLPPGMKSSVTAAMAAARDWWTGKPAGIVVDHEGIPDPHPGTPIRVSASVIDPLDLVRKTALYYRNGAGKPWSRVDGERRGGATRVELFIPGDAVGAGLEIEYYLELLDEHGGVLARLGEARSPRSRVVPGLPPGMIGPAVPGGKKGGGGGGGGRFPLWAAGAAGGAAALIVGSIIYFAIPKTVDLSVVTCVGACEK